MGAGFLNIYYVSPIPVHEIKLLMKVICLVPSLTETLIECGVEVVGRTRFCVHPKDKVCGIPKVGGTKGVDWQKVAELNADLVIFDREENLKAMADECPLPWHATHITSTKTVAAELGRLALSVNSDQLSQLAGQWQAVDSKANLNTVDFSNVPGQIELLANTKKSYQRVEYIIWREPWMAVNPNTFVGSMLVKLGFGGYLNDHQDSYPVLNEDQMADPDTFYLFSSEPFPFAKHRDSLLAAGFNGAIVDGEVYSWFGTRSYRALAKYLD
ncbi:MAG: hypothetical protein ACI9WC_003897 [Arenicella sp.]